MHNHTHTHTYIYIYIHTHTYNQSILWPRFTWPTFLWRLAESRHAFLRDASPQSEGKQSAVQFIGTAGNDCCETNVHGKSTIKFTVNSKLPNCSVNYCSSFPCCLRSMLVNHSNPMNQSINHWALSSSFFQIPSSILTYLVHHPHSGKMHSTSFHINQHFQNGMNMDETTGTNHTCASVSTVMCCTLSQLTPPTGHIAVLDQMRRIEHATIAVQISRKTAGCNPLSKGERCVVADPVVLVFRPCRYIYTTINHS